MIRVRIVREWGDLQAMEGFGYANPDWPRDLTKNLLDATFIEPVFCGALYTQIFRPTAERASRLGESARVRKVERQDQGSRGSWKRAARLYSCRARGRGLI
jgi:hypothetical protein